MSSDSHSVEEDEGFTYTWHIENFSMCPHKNAEYIKSPIFTMAMIKGAEFVLKLFPKGNENETDVSCILERVDKSDVDVMLSFEIKAVRGRNSATIFKKPELSRTFSESKKSWGCDALIGIQEIITARELILPNDTFTVKCRLWIFDSHAQCANNTSIISSCTVSDVLYECPDDGQPVELLSASEAAIIGVKRKFCPYPNEVIARSRVQVERTTFSWPIKEFSTLARKQKLFVPLSPSSKRVPPLMIVLHLAVDTKEDEAVKIEIHNRKEIVESSLLKLKITLMGSTENYIVVQEDKHFFTPKEAIWKFPPLIKKNMIAGNRDAYLPGDVLTLYGELTLSSGVETSWIEEMRYLTREYQNLLLNLDNGRNLQSDFSRLYDDQVLCDFSIKVQKQSFHVHKAVLLARSDVFKAMFELNMKEKGTNFVKIKDVDADTMKTMLKFMYTDNLDPLEIESAMKLYSAADKYAVMKLKELCADFLKANVSLVNMYDILVLAYMHHDQELNREVLDFICAHKSKILQSDDWLHFMKIRPKLTRMVLYQVCIRLPDMG